VCISLALQIRLESFECPPMTFVYHFVKDSILLETAFKKTSLELQVSLQSKQSTYNVLKALGGQKKKIKI